MSWSTESLTSAKTAAVPPTMTVVRAGAAVLVVPLSKALGLGSIIGYLVAGIATLVEGSLLGRPVEPGQARFSMLETIREYALDQLRGRRQRRWRG